MEACEGDRVVVGISKQGRKGSVQRSIQLHTEVPATSAAERPPVEPVRADGEADNRGDIGGADGVGEEAFLYRSMFENAIWGIFQTTANGKYLRANPALARIYGYGSPEEMLSALTDIGRQLYVDAGRRDEFVRLMHDEGSVSGFESQVYRHDGAIIWIAESCREVRSSAGDFLCYEGTVEEITRRKQTESELR